MTLAANERYVVDKKGKPVSVLLDIRSYHKMLEDLEEIAAIPEISREHFWGAPRPDTF